MESALNHVQLSVSADVAIGAFLSDSAVVLRLASEDLCPRRTWKCSCSSLISSPSFVVPADAEQLLQLLWMKKSLLASKYVLNSDMNIFSSHVNVFPSSP